MNKIKTIVVDDELEAREGVKTLLSNDNEIEVISLCKNGIEAIDVINDGLVDLMLLDIQMPVINGFEVINSITKDRMPFVIFVTAYDQYALKAFEVHAVDYLLKPFTNARFEEAIFRVKQLISQRKVDKEQRIFRHISDQLTKSNRQQDPLIVEVDEKSDKKDKRLVVKEKGKIHFVELDNIIWIEAFDYYVKVHLEDKFYLLRESMRKLESLLPVAKFIRIHKSSIINLLRIEHIQSIGNGEYMVKLKPDVEVKVSRNYNAVIRRYIS